MNPLERHRLNSLVGNAILPSVEPATIRVLIRFCCLTKVTSSGLHDDLTSAPRSEWFSKKSSRKEPGVAPEEAA